MYQVFVEERTGANQSGAMESRDHFKNAAIPKSHTSRRKFLTQVGMLLLVLCWAPPLFTSCKYFKSNKEPGKIDDVAVHPISPDSIMLNKMALLFHNANDKEQLIATVFPNDVSEEDKTVIWQSSNEAVATVDTTGVVTAVANGYAVITAFTMSGHEVICSVQVNIPNAQNNRTTVPATARPDNPGATPAPARPNNRTAVSPAPAATRLNDLLHQISNSDDQATDELRKLLGNNLRVEGAPNINNVQQLITDASNGSRYTVTKVNTDTDGRVLSISVSK